ncbi:MAG: hypothetical protein KDJ65_37390, partial [Anaerolineae bacterium]|nr:hypothetical protein [Anaerolineae bacterium]
GSNIHEHLRSEFGFYRPKGRAIALFRKNLNKKGTALSKVYTWGSTVPFFEYYTVVAIEKLVVGSCCRYGSGKHYDLIFKYRRQCSHIIRIQTASLCFDKQTLM